MAGSSICQCCTCKPVGNMEVISRAKCLARPPARISTFAGKAGKRSRIARMVVTVRPRPERAGLGLNIDFSPDDTFSRGAESSYFLAEAHWGCSKVVPTCKSKFTE